MNRSPVTFTLLFIVALAAACGALAGGAAVFAHGQAIQC